VLVDIQEAQEKTDAKVLVDFSAKRISQHPEYPALSDFPRPIARLIAHQIHAAEERVEKGKATPGFDALECQCLFFRRYQLPCKHMFHNQMIMGGSDKEENEGDGGDGGILDDAAWDQFLLMFEEGAGYDVWMTKTRVVDAEDGPSEHQLAREAAKRDLNEIIEQLRGLFFDALEQEAPVAEPNPKRRARRTANAEQPSQASQAGPVGRAAGPRSAEIISTLQKQVKEWRFHGATHGSQV